VTQRLVVIGGDAAGMSAASQARRLRHPDDLEIVAIERGAWTSYSACGIPYYVGGMVDPLDELVIREPDAFRAKDIQVRMHTEATELDLGRRRVLLDDEQWLDFDLLMIGTGARLLRPDVLGLDAPGVHGVATLADAQRIRTEVLERAPRRAVVLGGGYIGVEMADMLLRRGIQVTVVLADPLPLALLDEDMGERVCAAMSAMGIEVVTCAPVRAVETGEDGRVRRVLTESSMHPADIVVLGLGVRPDAGLAAAAGLPVGDSGGLRVDDRQRCAEGVWAAGDCTEATHRLTGKPIAIALGTHANRQGRVAGTNIGGGDARFAGVLGTAVTVVGETEIGRTGLSLREIEQAGLDADTTTLESTTRAGYFPGAESIVTKLLHERVTGRLLGAQIVGGRGSAKRIDVLATALWNEMTVSDLADVDLSYAPPFSPTLDPVSITARKAARR